MITPFQSKILRNQMDIEAASRGVARSMVVALDHARDAIATKLEKIPEGKLAYTRATLQARLMEIDATLVAVQNKWSDELTDARAEVLKGEYSSLTTLLNQQIAANEGMALLTVPTKLPISRMTALLENSILGKTQDAWLGNAFNRMKTDIGREMLQAQIMGEGGRAAATRLRNTLGLHRHSADIIARTTLIQAGTDARNEVYDANRQFFPSFSYLATLDSRTCLVCGPDDGLTKKNRTDLPTLVRHPRCRCAITANTIFDDVPMSREVVREEERHTVEHRDGTTSTKFTKTKVEKGDGSLTYEEFFKSQPEAWQREVLGSEKFELYKTGKLNLEDLRTHNRVLSVDELKARYQDRFAFDEQGNVKRVPGIKKRESTTSKSINKKPTLDIESFKDTPTLDPKTLEAERLAKRVKLEKTVQNEPHELTTEMINEWGSNYSIKWVKSVNGATVNKTDMVTSATDTAKIPEAHRIVNSRQGGRVEFIHGKGIPEHPERAHLKGVHPRGWPPGATWDTINGGGSKNLVVCTANKLYKGHGCVNLVLHEFGHSFDWNAAEAIGVSRLCQEPEFMKIWVANKAGKISLEYEINYVEEYFAESYAKYYHSAETRKLLPGNVKLYFKTLERTIRKLL